MCGFMCTNVNIFWGDLAGETAKIEEVLHPRHSTLQNKNATSASICISWRQEYQTSSLILLGILGSILHFHSASFTYGFVFKQEMKILNLMNTFLDTLILILCLYIAKNDFVCVVNSSVHLAFPSNRDL